MNQSPLLKSGYAFKKPNYIGLREYLFKTKTGEDFSVQFVRKQNNLSAFLIDFSIKNEELDEYQTINSDDIFRKMSTIVNIMLDFIENNPHCTILEFVPVEENDHKTNRRQKLFTRYAAIFCQLTGWKYTIQGNTFIIRQPKNK